MSKTRLKKENLNNLIINSQNGNIKALEELKTVFADIKNQSMEDSILQTMMKAREAELKYKIQQNLEIKESDNNQNQDNTNIS